MTGIGRGRQAILGILGPGIERSGVIVVTGPDPKEGGPKPPGLHVYPARFEHPCKPGRSIVGVVRDRDTGAPIAGAGVSSVFGVSSRATTDREGRFRLDGLSQSPSYVLTFSTSASDQRYITAERSVAATPGSEPLTADIAMVRGVVVTGRLIDRANGRPVQAWVGYAALKDNPHWSGLPGWIPTVNNKYRPSPGRHVPSMADGSYRIVVPPGRGILVAHIQYQADRYVPAGIPSKAHAGAPADALEPYYAAVPFEVFPQFFPAVRPVDIAPGTDAATYDLTLDSGIVRTGTVMDPEGHPLARATMNGESYQDKFELRPLDGANFAVYGLSPIPLLARTLVFRHAERRLGKTVRVEATETGPLEVRLEPAASITGRLLDDAGRPRDGIEIRVVRVFHDRTRSARADFDPPIRATTDVEGRFRIDGIVPGTVQKIRAGLRNNPEVFLIDDWTPEPGEVKDLGEVRR
jgi:protocatechuate 3,4-dioxygenase beta subunit